MTRIKILVASLFVVVYSFPAFGQADQSANFSPPNAIYHGSDLDHVSLPMLNVQATIPLVHLKGRGLDLDINATFNTQSWSTSEIDDPVAQTRTFETTSGASGGWSIGVARMGGVGSTTYKCVLYNG